MSTLHLKPDGAFCGGLLLQKTPQQQVMLFVNGQPVQQLLPVHAKCIECGTMVQLNPPKPQKQIDAEFEVINKEPYVDQNLHPGPAITMEADSSQVQALGTSEPA